MKSKWMKVTLLAVCIAALLMSVGMMGILATEESAEETTATETAATETSATEPTPTETGATETSATEPTPAETTPSETETTPSETTTPETPSECNHTWGTWQKTDDAYHARTCTTCNATETVAHTWNSGDVIQAATCKDAGVKLYICADCGAVKVETVPATKNHTWGKWQQDTAEQHKRVCSTCDTSETAEHAWDKGYITVEPVGGSNGQMRYTCTDCGAIKNVVIPSNHTHTYTEEWLYDGTMHYHECTSCGGKQGTTVHVWDAGKVITAATAQKDGLSLFTCIVCGAQKERATSFEEKEHVFGAWIYYDADLHVHSCDCGEEEFALHRFGAWTVVTAATTSEEGLESRVCADCDALEERTIAMLPAETTETTPTVTNPVPTEPTPTEPTPTEPTEPDIETMPADATTVNNGNGGGHTALIVVIVILAVIVVSGVVIFCVWFFTKRKKPNGISVR